MNLRDYLIQVLELEESDLSVEMIEQEPAFTFTLEERRGGE